MRTGSEVLNVERVSVSFPGRNVLEAVDFKLSTGEFCGLIGSNGSGKTTLLRTVLGFQKPNAGTIRIGGMSGLRSVGYVPQKIILDPYIPMRARDVVALGLDGHRLGLPLPSKLRWKQVDEMLEAVDAGCFADQRIGNLSGGQQQRILIAPCPYSPSPSPVAR